MLPKVNKANKVGTMEAIKEYLRLHCGVMRGHLAYVIMETTVVKTYDEYHRYVTTDNKIFTMMLHLPQDKNRLSIESLVSFAKEHTPEYEIDNRGVYDIINQIC